MGKLILVTGGTRSGKSDYAQGLAESLPGPRLFVATCPKIDPEMDERIRKHQQARANASWRTLEEELELCAIFEKIDGIGICLIDCMTLWVNNLLFYEESSGGALTEEKMTDHCRRLVANIKKFSGTIICVTNEVGMGIVPENQASRRYRDLVGCCNRIIASAADQVVLVTCGLPLVLKGEKTT
jgi:adenosylcobinamide kinase / adenosylcobinamide-phosphate guanylyltransferase